MAETPVGDYIRRRYPDNPREIHWLGNGDDPGCCGGAHPACLYIAAFAEGAAVEREHVAQSAEIEALALLAEGRAAAADALKDFADLIRQPITGRNRP